MVRKRIIIVGAGFGGIYVAGGLRKLANREKAEIILISPQNYFLFTPLLHEVATGGLSPVSVAEPIREIFYKDKIKFHQTRVNSVDLENRLITTEQENINYDILVLATGATTNFYNIPGAERYGLPLKSLRDSVFIRSKIIDAFEQAALISDQNLRQELLTFVVVGAGATGVELVGEVAEFVFNTLYPYYKNTFCKSRDIKVILVSSGEEILTLFPKSVRLWSEKELVKKSVLLKRGSSVLEVKEREVVLDSREIIKTRIVLWTAGVRPDLPEIKGKVKFHQSGRILVDQTLRAEGFEDVFVLGDSAAFLENGESKVLPMFAQVAVKESETVVKNIKAIISDKNKNLNKFNYRTSGFLVSIGQWRAVGVILGFRLQGRFAWWVWRTVYLFKFISWRKKLRIAFEWTINLFYPRDTTKIG